MRQDFKSLRVGSSAADSINKTIGDRWRSMTEEEKLPFAAKADQVQRERDALKSRPLRARETNDVLSGSQLQRLNNARVDPSLQQVAQHPAWKAGLGLSDHVSALRPEHIWNAADRNDMTVAFRNIFAYDPTIHANEQLYGFEQPCGVACGGTCKEEPCFPLVASLVKDLDNALQAAGLRDRPALVSVVPQQEPDSPRTWFLVGCVSRRNLAHCIISLVQTESQKLSLHVERGQPGMGTTHRIFKSLLLRHVSLGGVGSEFAAEAIGLQRCPVYLLSSVSLRRP